MDEKFSLRETLREKIMVGSLMCSIGSWLILAAVCTLAITAVVTMACLKLLLIAISWF